jgi:hypothetical protein
MTNDATCFTWGDPKTAVAPPFLRGVRGDQNVVGLGYKTCVYTVVQGKGENSKSLSFKERDLERGFPHTVKRLINGVQSLINGVQSLINGAKSLINGVQSLINGV